MLKILVLELVAKIEMWLEHVLIKTRGRSKEVWI
jgi:hypothetical protein